MSQDLYCEWLDLPDGPRPPDFYALLRVPRFCIQPELIEDAAHRQLERLDHFALDQDKARRARCQEMMNEVAKARVVLLSAPLRKLYDQALHEGRHDPTVGSTAPTQGLNSPKRETRPPRQGLRSVRPPTSGTRKLPGIVVVIAASLAFGFLAIWTYVRWYDASKATPVHVTLVPTRPSVNSASSTAITEVASDIDLGRPVVEGAANSLAVIASRIPTSRSSDDESVEPAGDLADREFLSLTWRKPLEVRVGWDQLRVNQLPQSKQLIIRDAPCKEFIFAHTNSRVTFAVPSGATHFAAVAASAAYWDCSFKITDHRDMALYESKSLDSYPDHVAPVVIALPSDCTQIHLYTRYLGTGGGTWAVWAYPRFYWGSADNIALYQSNPDASAAPKSTSAGGGLAHDKPAATLPAVASNATGATQRAPATAPANIVPEVTAPEMEAFRKRLATYGITAKLSPIREGGIETHVTKIDGCTTLWPFWGMPIRKLSLRGWKGLKSLEGIEGMPLHELQISNCEDVLGLAALRGMHLSKLRLSGCKQINSLEGLEAMPLTELDIFMCENVKTLSPLKGAPLVRLWLSHLDKLESLEGLERMPLVELGLSYCPKIESLLPLSGMPLKRLRLYGLSGLTSIDELDGMPLTELDLTETTVASQYNPFRKNLQGAELATLMGMLRQHRPAIVNAKQRLEKVLAERQQAAMALPSFRALDAQCTEARNRMTRARERGTIEERLNASAEYNKLRLSRDKIVSDAIAVDPEVVRAREELERATAATTRPVPPNRTFWFRD